MTKILAISDVHGEENENLYTYLNNNDIDLVLILAPGAENQPTPDKQPDGLNRLIQHHPGL